MRVWLQLIRFPNLFTVPGDPLAGAVLAAQSTQFGLPIGLAMAAAVCFYTAGLLWNDYYDLKRDRRERPGRPLPSGKIQPRVAFSLGLILSATGWSLCLFAGPGPAGVGATLVAFVFCYNRYFKRIPVLREASMGACRGLSLLLGAAAATSSSPFPGPVIVAAVVLFFYTASVTFAARREAQPHHSGPDSAIPFGVLLVGLMFFWPWVPSSNQRAAFLLAYGVSLLITAGFALHMILFSDTPNLPRSLERRQRMVHVLPPWIGCLVSGLIPLQAAFILQVGMDDDGLLLVGLLAAGLGLNRLFSRWLPAS